MNRFPTTFVASGSFVTETQKPLVLRACLGTCVGVAIYDPLAGVGGLAHLLLADPPAHPGYDHPEKYAASGLPLFLDQLLQQGATNQNMRAWIAGGALVGTVTRQDVHLDVGGKTVETVIEILNRRQILIQNGETGGFYPCVLTLNLSTGRADIQPAVAEVNPEKPLPAPTTNGIERACQQIQPIPQVVLKILRLINADKYDLTQLTAEVKKDQALTARILKVFHSAAFSGYNKIDSLDHCLLILGQTMLSRVILTSSINALFENTGGGYALCRGGLYHHAIGTAVIAETIATETGLTPPETAYTAGLLHDIGMLVLDQFLAAADPLFYRTPTKTEPEMLQAENNRLGTNHTLTGALLAQKWQFPDSIAAVISHHHHPEKAPAEYALLVHVVYLAELLMSRFRSDLAKEAVNTQHLEARLDTLGLSFNTFYDMIDKIPLDILGAYPEQAITRRP